MHFNNTSSFGGGNHRPFDRGDSVGNKRGDFNSRGRYAPGMPLPFEINQPVRHIATGIKLIVIKYGREQIECRKPDLSAEYFYDYELEPWIEEIG